MKTVGAYKIEKNIPQPHPRVKYPFVDMDVGDSFAFTETYKRRITSSAYYYGARNNIKFSIRGLRVWRIE